MITIVRNQTYETYKFNPITLLVISLVDVQVFDEHSSVAESRRKQTEPISLDSCLQAFTKEEHLGEQELYFCSKCKEHRQAVKKLEIWKIPPILVSVALDTLFIIELNANNDDLLF